MKLIGAIGAALLSLSLGIPGPAWARQEQHDQENKEQKDKAPAQKEKARQPDKPARQDEQHARDLPPAHEATHTVQQKGSPARQEKPQAEQPGERKDQKPREMQPAHEAAHTVQQRNQAAPQPQPQRTEEQQRVEKSAWQQHRSQRWESDHRTWQQRGGYRGYRIPDDRFRGYFGQEHEFRIYGLPFLVVGGFPRFQYNGYWVSLVDPWPQDWSDNWYDTDDVYVVYVNDGYYLFNRNHPSVGIAISISM